VQQRFGREGLAVPSDLDAHREEVVFAIRLGHLRRPGEIFEGRRERPGQQRIGRAREPFVVEQVHGGHAVLRERARDQEHGRFVRGAHLGAGRREQRDGHQTHDGETDQGFEQEEAFPPASAAGRFSAREHGRSRDRR
jgi:hypothetical protein